MYVLLPYLVYRQSTFVARDSCPIVICGAFPFFWSLTGVAFSLVLLDSVSPRRRAYYVYKKPNSYSLSNRRLSIATWQCVAMDLFTDKFIIEGSAVAVPCNVVEEGIIAHVSLTTIMVSLQENIDLDIAYIVDSLPQFCLYVL